MRSRSTRSPSSEATRPSRNKRPRRMVARAPIGIWHPPSSVLRKVLSAMTHRRKPDVGIEPAGDAIFPPQPYHAGGREDDGVVLAVVEPGQARVQVPPQIQDLQVVPQRAELRSPSKRAGADAGARRKRG